MWHADQILASDLPVPLKKFIADILGQLPFSLPHVSSPGGWGDFLELHRCQKKWGKFLRVQLPDVGNIVTFLWQQLAEYNPRYREIRRQNSNYRYLERYYLYANDSFSLDLHRFLASDPDPLHYHPWEWACSILLSGNCYERFLMRKASHQCESFYKKPGTVSLLTENDFHQVRLEREEPKEHEIWTLFLHPRERCDGFGFLERAHGEKIYFDGMENPFSRLIFTDAEDGNYKSLREDGQRAHELWAKNGELIP